MAPGSSIVNVSSIAARSSVAAPYPAAKAALCGLTRALARQSSGRQGIRVNALVPGSFPPRMTGPMPADRVGDGLVIDRVGLRAELGAALVFLASDASAHMTGAALVVERGFTRMMAVPTGSQHGADPPQGQQIHTLRGAERAPARGPVGVDE